MAEVRSAVRDVLRGVGSSVLVACSGGADSLALAAATAFEAPRQNVNAGLVTVDHGLQAGSHERACRVADLGAELGLDPVIVLPVFVGSHGGLEAAARDARSAALSSTAAALDSLVLLGHTLDDQAETVLLGLGRGSGPRSLAGMPLRREPYLRPLLDLRRATTRAACLALGLEPWDDPHNGDPRFRRVRVRSEVLPLLEDALGGGVAEALARTARLAGDDLDALEDWARVALDTARDGDALDVAALAGLPRAVRSRVVRRWLAEQGLPAPSLERTAAVDALIVAWRGQAGVDLPSGARVRRAAGRLTVHPRPTA